MVDTQPESGIPELAYPADYRDIGRAHRIFMASLHCVYYPRYAREFDRPIITATVQLADIVECLCGAQVRRWPDGRKEDYATGNPHACHDAESDPPIPLRRWTPEPRRTEEPETTNRGPIIL